MTLSQFRAIVDDLYVPLEDLELPSAPALVAATEAFEDAIAAFLLASKDLA
jgi:hypothetical protein